MQASSEQVNVLTEWLKPEEGFRDLSAADRMVSMEHEDMRGGSLQLGGQAPLLLPPNFFQPPLKPVPAKPSPLPSTNGVPSAPLTLEEVEGQLTSNSSAALREFHFDLAPILRALDFTNIREPA